MKSPELRKELSELTLHKRGIRINLQLPLIESEDEITLRSEEQLRDRMLALHLCCLVAQPEQQALVHQLITARQLRHSLSAQEASWIEGGLSPSALPEFAMHCHYALHFLQWATGLQSTPGMPDRAERLADLNLTNNLLATEGHTTQVSLRVRSKSDLLDWADLLYRLHWSVRHAHITNKPTPGRLHAASVLAWHQAANWLIAYDNEDNWDLVSTETGG
ncbi:DUF4272 domain-containing protein [Undibacterium rugosum]|uniref:DUF4272 domain-containing protein n=1 Tax=Undibacterium rugosum TaxID=2762291 RepID=A0A923KZW2_9BURK|nr:DUF4272 domain-containing protein [Undibacterium rugosum]MBC3936725.1 DUF4272 domain-containing protein [Undibacterium rugosum]MBR7779697.1 DUF4272 domain-containing protein [Undibacterium rugosum]